MTAVANTVAELGTGDYNLQEKIIQYGPVGKKERFGMRWRADMPTPCWVSDEQIGIDQRDAWIMNAEAIPTPGTSWAYITLPSGSPGLIGQSSYSWNPDAIRHADAAFVAGLKLQESWVLDAWAWFPTDVYTLASVWFPISQGDWISNVLIPDNHIGIQVNLLGGLRRFQVTSWVDSAKQDTRVIPADATTAKTNLMPHLYSKRTSGSSGPNIIEFICCKWRWVGIP